MTFSTLVMVLAVVLMAVDASPQQQFYYRQAPAGPASPYYYSPSRQQSYFSPLYPNYYRSYPSRQYFNYQPWQHQYQQQPFYDQSILPYSYKHYQNKPSLAAEQRSDSLSEPESPIEGAVFVPANVNAAFGGSLSVFEASQLASGSQLEELDPVFYPLVGLRPNNPFELAQPRPTVARNGPYFYRQQASNSNGHPAFYYNYL